MIAVLTLPQVWRQFWLWARLPISCWTTSIARSSENRPTMGVTFSGGRNRKSVSRGNATAPHRRGDLESLWQGFLRLHNWWDVLLNIYRTTVGERTSRIIYVLTILSAVFLPVTFISSVYATRFEYLPGVDLPIWALRHALGHDRHCCCYAWAYEEESMVLTHYQPVTFPEALKLPGR